MLNRTTNLDIVEYFQNGRNFQRMGLLEEAAQQFLSVIKLDSPSASAYFNMGSIRFQQHKYEEAIRYYKAGLDLTRSGLPAQHESVHADLGKSYEMLGKWDEALYHLNKALDLNPNHQAAQRRKRRVLEEKYKYEILQREAQSAIKWAAASKSKSIDIERLMVYFDEIASEEIRTQIRRLLARIYLELGDKFDCYPQQKIKIFFLSGLEEIQRLLLPQWATGQYDGNIIIVCRDKEKIDLSLLYVVLRHEYVHLLVNMLTNGQCPTWLNEGLARYYSRGLLHSEKEILLQTVRQNLYIPLKHLKDSFSYLSKERIRLAYIESCSAVEFMMENYGMKKIKKLLHLLETGKSFPESLMYSLGKNAKQHFILNLLKRCGQAFTTTSEKELEAQWLTWVMESYK